MEKRLIAAILLTVVFLFLYTTLVRPPEEQPPDPAPREITEPPEARPQEREEFTPEARPEIPKTEAEKVVVETDLYRAVITSAGAGLESFRLKNYSERWRPMEEIEREITSVEDRISKTTSDILKLRTRMRNESNGERLSRLKDREEGIRLEQEHLEASLERLEALKEHVDARRRKIDELKDRLAAADNPELVDELERRLVIEKGVELIPPGANPPAITFPSLSLDLSLTRFKSDKSYLRVTDEEKTVRFTASAGSGLEINKTFTFSNDNYALGLNWAITNNTGGDIAEEDMRIAYSPGVGLEESAPARGVITGIVSFIDGVVHTDRIAAGRSPISPEAPKLRAGRDVWTAIKGKYFAAAMIPEFQHCVLSAGILPGGGKEMQITHPKINIADGETFPAGVRIYLGPQSAEELSKAEESLTDIIDYGFWSPVAKVIDYLLSVFYGMVNNFGAAIIMLSLTVKIAFYPLTHKSFTAMKKMQDDMKAIQPKIDELKKKYGNNQQKMNKAMMELYKKEGVNPMSGCKGGCFPMLLQMPVFFALYAVLNTSIDLRGAPFLWWITDLSMPDPMRILPILMGVSMFWQQKLTGSGAAGPQQEQAKMMQWMMPVMLTFIFFGLPAGIVLYWFSFNIFTSLQQMVIKKHGA